MKKVIASIVAAGVLTMGIGAGNAMAVTKSTSARVDATYVGWADNSSFEINVNGKPKVIRVLDTNKSLVKGVKKGDNITMTYWVNIKGQNILGKEFKKKTVATPVKTHKALIVYTGLIDNHSFEAVFGEKDTVVQVNEKTISLVKGLKRGDVVSITYTINAHGQYVLQTLKK